MYPPPPLPASPLPSSYVVMFCTPLPASPLPSSYIVMCCTPLPPSPPPRQPPSFLLYGDVSGSVVVLTFLRPLNGLFLPHNKEDDSTQLIPFSVR